MQGPLLPARRREPRRDAGGNFARSRQVEIFSSDYDAILEDNGIDLVVLATRHNEHAHQVIRALEAGKHVFVEKPLAISWDELDAVRDKIAGLDDAPRVMVGFNRRFSPALQMLKQELGASRTPLMINYRLNAGYIPLAHWVHGAEGGGRNIGEACHMYDCFAFLTGAPVASISATSIDPGDRAYKRNDNFCATVRYDDGSVCTLSYVALGPKTGSAKGADRGLRQRRCVGRGRFQELDAGKRRRGPVVGCGIGQGPLRGDVAIRPKHRIRRAVAYSAAADLRDVRGRTARGGLALWTRGRGISMNISYVDSALRHGGRRLVFFPGPAVYHNSGW